MDKRKDWVMGWAVYIPNKGHVWVEYRDGKAVWINGEYIRPDLSNAPRG